MTSPAISAQGMTLSVKDGASFVQITGFASFNGPGGSAAVLDATDLSSLAKEKLLGLRDEGQLSFTLRYNPGQASHKKLRQLRADSARGEFKLSFTDAEQTVWAFEGFVPTFTIQGGVDALVEASVTIEITGVITETFTPVTP